MEIEYAQLINSFVSTEGRDGIMTNYIYYSVLVVFKNGTRKIVEDMAQNLGFLLPYIRTPQDTLRELQETVRGLREDLNDLADRKIRYFVDTLFPLPDVLGMRETEARKTLEQAGFIWHPVVQYPEGTPESGVVRACVRNDEHFKTADVTVFHPVPEVLGLPREEALNALKKAGFTAKTEKQIVAGRENDRVLACVRADEFEMKVTLTVSTAIPETKGLPLEEARRLLRQQGYTVREEAVPGLSDAGKVVSWEDLGENTIRLKYGIPDTVVCRQTELEWSHMQGSVGDQYAAKAVYVTRARKMVITITGWTGVRTRHQICGVTAKEGYGQGELTVSPANLEPEHECEFDVTMANVRYEDLPGSLAFQVETQYGLMKKKETISFQLKLQWT